MRRVGILAAAVAFVLLVACSGSAGTPPAADTSSSLSTTPSEATPSSSASGGSTGQQLTTAKVQGVGTVLTNEEGFVLYLFTNDTGTKSTCSGSCAETWPPFTSQGAPQAGSGVDDGKIGTSGSGTTTQVTYDGHPLYLFSGDTKAGQANGQGVGGIWFAVTPDGNAAGQGDDNGGGGG